MQTIARRMLMLSLPSVIHLHDLAPCTMPEGSRHYARQSRQSPPSCAVPMVPKAASLSLLFLRFFLHIFLYLPRGLLFALIRLSFGLLATNASSSCARCTLSFSSPVVLVPAHIFSSLYALFFCHTSSFAVAYLCLSLILPTLRKLYHLLHSLHTSAPTSRDLA